MNIEAFDQSESLAEMAGLLADTSRVSMTLALLDGRAYTASELARAANISPQTASFHLRKLVNADFVQFVSQGRHRYFRLAGSDAAQMLETLLVLPHASTPVKQKTSCPPHLRFARSCYDHLAGKVGVAIYRAMLSNGWLAPHGQFLVATPAASPLLMELGIPESPGSLQAKQCLDWSEREFHLAGDFGRLLFSAMLERRWLLRGDARAITPTEDGLRHLSAWSLR